MLELNKIHRGDCLDLLRSLPDCSVDLVVTDPPYGIDFKSNHRKQSSLKSVNGILNDGKDNINFLHEVIKEVHRVLKENSHLYWFTRWDKVQEQHPILEKYFSVKNNIIWMKNNWSMGDLDGSYAGQYENIIFCQKGNKPLKKVDGRTRHSDILKFDRVSPDKLKHSHEKPIELIKFLIKKSSDIGDVVLDPFMGSGTTAVACLDSDRYFIGAEQEKEFFKICQKRIKHHSSQLSLL